MALNCSSNTLIIYILINASGYVSCDDDEPHSSCISFGFAECFQSILEEEIKWNKTHFENCS